MNTHPDTLSRPTWLLQVYRHSWAREYKLACHYKPDMEGRNNRRRHAMCLDFRNDLLLHALATKCPMSKPNEPRTALLAGATGLVGRCCLERLLECPTYGRVQVLVRRPLEVRHDKLDEKRVDFDKLESLELNPVDDVFITLGTTIKAAGSQDAFYKVDHDYVVATAKLAKRFGASRLALVSSIGVGGIAANFYLRVKADTERDTMALGYECVEIFRPGLLVGERHEKRPGEALGIAAMKVASTAFLGPLRQYRPIDATDVAAAMVAAMRKGQTGARVRTFEEMMKLARG